MSANSNTQIQSLSPKKMENNTLQTMGDTNHKKELERYIARIMKDVGSLGKIYICDLCEKSFQYIPLLNKHKRNSHSMLLDDLATVTGMIGDNIGIGEPLLNTTVEKVNK